MQNGFCGSVKASFLIVVLCLTISAWTSVYTSTEGGMPAPKTPYPRVPVTMTAADLFFPQQAVNCEDVMLYLDDAVGQNNKLQDTYLIVIARLGKRETSRRLNLTRLQSIESYIRPKSIGKVITAEGKSADGLGQVEIYVGGRLLYVMPIARNEANFCRHPVG